METINGYTVIASHQPPDEGMRVILAVIRFPAGPDRPERVEYVTAWAEVGPVGSWYWGHYFGGHASESTLFLDAVESFMERAHLQMPVSV